MLFHQILEDNDIEGIFNFGTNTYAVVNELVPRKKYLLFPVSSLKPLLWLLWNLRILNLQPVSINYSIYPVLVDPAKLVSRFNYRFKYSSSEAFLDTLSHNLLPHDSLF
jgi:hypothetical protein